MCRSFRRHGACLRHLKAILMPENASTASFWKKVRVLLPVPAISGALSVLYDGMIGNKKYPYDLARGWWN